MGLRVLRVEKWEEREWGERKGYGETWKGWAFKKWDG